MRSTLIIAPFALAIAAVSAAPSPMTVADPNAYLAAPGLPIYYLPLAASSQMVLRVPFEQAQAIATVARDTFYFLCQNGGGVASFHSGKDWINSFQAKVSCQKQNVDDQDITDYVRELLQWEVTPVPKTSPVTPEPMGLPVFYKSQAYRKRHMGNISESEAKHLADAAKVKWDGRCTDMGGVSGFNKNLDAVRTENWANSFIATVNCDKNGKDIAENVMKSLGWTPNSPIAN